MSWTKLVNLFANIKRALFQCSVVCTADQRGLLHQQQNRDEAGGHGWVSVNMHPSTWPFDSAASLVEGESARVNENQWIIRRQTSRKDSSFSDKKKSHWMSWNMQAAMATDLQVWQPSSKWTTLLLLPLIKKKPPFYCRVSQASLRELERWTSESVNLILVYWSQLRAHLVLLVEIFVNWSTKMLFFQNASKYCISEPFYASSVWRAKCMVWHDSHNVWLDGRNFAWRGREGGGNDSMTWRQRKPPVSVSPCNVLHLSQMFLLMGACLTLIGKIAVDIFCFEGERCKTSYRTCP